MENGTIGKTKRVGNQIISCDVHIYVQEIFNIHCFAFVHIALLGGAVENGTIFWSVLFEYTTQY